MRMKSLLAALAAVFAVGAHAGTALVGQNGAPLALVMQSGTSTGDAYQLGLLGSNWTTLFTTLSTPGSFTEFADFSIGAGNGGVNGSANTYALMFGPITLGSISNLQVSIKDSSWNNVSGGLINGGSQISLGGLAAGNYHLQITGLVNGVGGQYSVGLQALPVPEPETYALMLAGLGAVGFVARRRQRQ